MNAKNQPKEMKKKKSSNVECLHTSASNWCITALNERHSLNIAWKLNITHCFHISKRWFGFWHTSWCPHSLHRHIVEWQRVRQIYVRSYMCYKQGMRCNIPPQLFIYTCAYLKSNSLPEKEEKVGKRCYLCIYTCRHEGTRSKFM